MQARNRILPRLILWTACFFWLGIVLNLSLAGGSVIRAKSVSFGDVSSAVRSAHDGDTVVIPEGTASWTSTLVMDKGITLQGETTVNGNEPGKFIVTERTVILDNVSRIRSAGKANKFDDLAVIYGNFSPSQLPRITGITFKVGSITTQDYSSAVLLEGTCPNVRIDHCNFYHLTRNNLFTSGNLFGVCDHCQFENNAGSGRININHSTYTPAGDTKSYNNGDGSWIDGPNFGSNRFWFFEDCAFRSVEGGHHGNLDGQLGMRRVIRHCYFFGTFDGYHGTESGQRQRGSRAAETYLNTYDTRTNEVNLSQLRAGTDLRWGNTILSGPDFRGWQPTINRQRQYFSPWGAANGANPLDNNDTEGNGQYVAGHSPHLFYSGKITSSVLDPHGLPTSITLNGIDGTKDWTGYSISDLGTGRVDFHHAANNDANCALIASNTGTTLNVSGIQNRHSKAASWAAANSIVIYHLARASLDQPGMGKADLVVGNPPTNTRWPNQRVEPLYSWLNTNNGSDFLNAYQPSRTARYPTLRENRDYFNWKGPQTSKTSPFDGTSGVGSGTHAERPTTCTPGLDGNGAPGVGYWETDTNTFFVCTAANSWSAYYKPYIYPHPLVSGKSPASSEAKATKPR